MQVQIQSGGATVLNGHTAAGQQALNQFLASAGVPPSGSGQPSGSLECECCERYVSALPYTHTDSNPPYTTWSYCQECYDAGCSGPNGYCELDETFETLGDCVVCKKTQQPLAMYGEHPWCIDCHGKYTEYLETHPIPPKDRFTPVYRGEHQPLAHMPAYMYPPEQWDQANFKPEYILDPAKAPRPTKKKAHIVTQQPQPAAGLTEQDVLRLIEQAQGGGQAGPSTAVTIDAMLESIDPRDSDTALKLFNWLRDNARLHKVATLDQGGYLFLYQEPEGASRQGYTAGGTQGDRIVDDALEKAQAGGKPLKGLCKKCFSPVVKVDDGPVNAETPRAGTDAAVCSDGGVHEFAG